VERGSLRYNFPHADLRIEAGDTLVCYGKLSLLRELLPPVKGGEAKGPSRRRSRRKEKEEASPKG
jgi:hypothetical protein